MAILTHKCPHCLTEHIGLTVLAGNKLPGGWVAHLECPKCHMPSAAALKQVRAAVTDWKQLIPTNADVTSFGWGVREFWPDVPEPDIPKHMPPDISRVYLQAERNFMIEGNEEAAGMMYRKALDIGLKKIDPSLTGMLGPRIKKLVAAGKLIPDIADWADNIRDVGNDAAHEEQAISRDELIELRNLSEMVLRSLFTLPNTIKKRRGEALPWETTNDEGDGGTAD